MYNYQKISFLAVALTLGISATASAQSFPQDYLSLNQSTQSNHAVTVESKPGIRLATSFHDQVIASSHYANELKNTDTPVEHGKVQDKGMTMTDAKSTSSFHLFTQYL
jgi:hypothetical protein